MDVYSPDLFELLEALEAAGLGFEPCGIPLEAFVDCWFRVPRDSREPYDFFLLKIERFVEYIRDVMPDATGMVEREAEILRTAYHSANEQISLSGVSS